VQRSIQNSLKLTLSLAVITVVSLVVGSSRPAQACGGFFCNASSPVNQAAERIIFARNGDGTLTQLVQILYSGPSERFAWVLPVPGIPEVGVSSDLAFQRLQTATNPTYRLNTTIEGECARESFPDMGMADAATSSAADMYESGPPPVTVVASGSVGPFDWEVISVDPELDDLADAAVEWLQDNSYDIAPQTAEVLGPYLDDGMNLIAFRLTKGAHAGSIRPVSLTFTSPTPMIPIRPTAVAATQDMGVMVWVLGAVRAFPANYVHLELNEARINWLNPASNYNQLVSEAADEAGGQGFVTEYAREFHGMADVVVTQADRNAWDSVLDLSEDPEALLRRAILNFGSWDGFTDVLDATVPMPDGMTAQTLMNCVTCSGGSFNEFDMGFDGGSSDADIYEDRCGCGLEWRTAVQEVSTTTLIASMQERVIDPMFDTADLFDSLPYLTRLYTTISPTEMTLDPVFAFNQNLPEVDNVHVGERIIECSASVFQWEAPWRAELPNGQVVRGVGNQWPADGAGSSAAVTGTELSEDGEDIVLFDNTEEIEDSLDEHNATVVREPNGRAASTACSTAPSESAPSVGFIALAFGLVLARRRTRRQR